MQTDNASFFAHPTAVIDTGCQIGEGTHIWHFTHIMSGCVIGRNCTIGQNVVVAPGVTLGNRVKVQNNVSVYAGVVCEDDVFLGPSCVFTNVLTPRSFINRKNTFLPTLIKKGATIGANATILCGHVVGEYALIGAGAVLTKDAPPHSLWTGNPARLTGWVCRCGHSLHSNEAGETCPECGETLSDINSQKI
ncbi:MAG: N-acetyltransferase [Bacteroidales bacterium]|jgi:UDP-2-acetamido-3-amino-2,3-dideoxy-glucuronate N-acetyltransferase|nr:N-acetyltransferase [Bacteroidales bacterium]